MLRSLRFCGLLSLALSGCIGYTTDSQGHLNSVGVPGAPQSMWQSNASAPAIKPTDLGMTPEQAANVGGPVLVVPTVDGTHWQYRFYNKGDNHCEEDLKKELAERASLGAGGPSPYCSENPTAPPNPGTRILF
jgi:hypothetical protein